MIKSAQTKIRSALFLLLTLLLVGCGPTSLI